MDRPRRPRTTGSRGTGPALTSEVPATMPSDPVIGNRAAILANQEPIRDNRKKLDKVLASQKKILEKRPSGRLVVSDAGGRAVIGMGRDGGHRTASLPREPSGGF